MRMRNDRTDWFGVGIPTTAVLAKAKRRAERRRRGVAAIIAAMENGAFLRMEFANGRELWRLSNGLFVVADVAAVVIGRPEIVSCGDTLFAGMRGQTWRHVGEQGR